ncbi:cation:proton antiporter [Parachitinimonas caeni]|uniref:Cation:proton antiporter n=1 Tax=Parachitinimonas caeni TaxID=3031301 RepID=A0ABT7DT27_9NEIS|nr:cation:proton antiporter [Parachitinimonas caeni]MDK2123231.1 cation:proton antiporter [Parachitinimonas caeni]
MKRRDPKLFLLGTASTLPAIAWASGTAHTSTHLLWLLIILLAARLSNLIEKIGQPAVLGELLIGIILGNLGLLGLHQLDAIRSDSIMEFLAKLGVIILLFQIGLESNLDVMRRVGLRALMVASVGVIIPFIFGTLLIGPLLLPESSSITYLFIGATLTATSVGITGRVFKDAGILHSVEASIVLGAAVIDDVLGLVILAVVSAIASKGSISPIEVSRILLLAVAFLAGSIIVGRKLAPLISTLLSRLNPGKAMQFTMLACFCFGFAYAANLVGLDPIVGAFAAGLILEASYVHNFEPDSLHVELREVMTPAEPMLQQAVKHLLERENQHRLNRQIEPVGYLLVPIFFVMSGMQVNLATLADSKTILIAAVISAAAVIGKIASATIAGPVNRWLVGWGMVPRGEVGLIFAAIGKQLQVIPDQLYSVLVLVIVFTTLITPPTLNLIIKRSQSEP